MKQRTRRVVVLGALAMAAIASPSGGVSAKRDPVYEIDREALTETIAFVEGSTGQEVLSGEIAGAAWIAQIPEDWNGDLVVWAHGYRGEGTDLTVDPPPSFEWLISQGYAWAASSYRRNSYDPGIGVVDTKNLTRHMQSLLRARGRAGQDLPRRRLDGWSCHRGRDRDVPEHLGRRAPGLWCDR